MPLLQVQHNPCVVGARPKPRRRPAFWLIESVGKAFVCPEPSPKCAFQRDLWSNRAGARFTLEGAFGGRFSSRLIDKLIKLRDYRDDSGGTPTAFTRKGLSGGGVSIRDSLSELRDLTGVKAP